MEKPILGISLVSEYLYCPRSFAYRLIDFKPQEDDNFYIVDGRINHERLDLKKTAYNREGLIEKRGVYVRSSLGVVGKIDRVIYEGNLVRIIEEKRGRLRNNSQHDLQCLIEAYCFEETFPDLQVSSCLIYYQQSRRFRELEWNDKEREKVNKFFLMINEKCRQLSLSEFQQVLDERCYGCMFQETCGVS